MNAHDVLKIAAESAALKQRFFAKNAGLLVEVGGRVAERLRTGGTVLVFGNGGSAADAQHLAGELVGSSARSRPLAARATSRWPHDETPRVQEVHAMVVHLLCQIVEQAVAR
jgi:phosphoheptose isomerase